MHRLNRDVVVRIPLSALGEPAASSDADNVHADVSVYEKDPGPAGMLSKVFPAGSRVENMAEVAGCDLVLCQIAGYVVAVHWATLSIEH
jgi:hypothetical protein